MHPLYRLILVKSFCYQVYRSLKLSHSCIKNCKFCDPLLWRWFGWFRFADISRETSMATWRRPSVALILRSYSSTAVNSGLKQTRCGEPHGLHFIAVNSIPSASPSRSSMGDNAKIHEDTPELEIICVIKIQLSDAHLNNLSPMRWFMFRT
jgi:hypothetical protein